MTCIGLPNCSGPACRTARLTSRASRACSSTPSTFINQKHFHPQLSRVHRLRSLTTAGLCLSIPVDFRQLGPDPVFLHRDIVTDGHSLLSDLDLLYFKLPHYLTPQHSLCEALNTALCLFGSDSDSEDESYLTKDECQRFNAIISILAWTNNSSFDTKRKQPSTS